MEQKEAREHAVEPLLRGDEALSCASEEEFKDEFSRFDQKPKRRIWRGLFPWLLHSSIIVVYSLVIFAVILPRLQRHVLQEGKEGNQPHLPLPDRQGLKWEYRRFPTNIVNNPFAGPPREEMEQAWHKFLRNDNIRVPIGYLKEKNLTSVYTKDHSEGIASLSVYHSLHCLKKVKRMMFKEHYYANKDEESMAREIKHADHCVEYIRESLMCQPDLSLVTFRWINNTAQHEDPTEFYPTNFDKDMHYCANWEHLDGWAGERMFDLFRVDLLDRPEKSSG
ncbi:hypothetical protein TESG_02781 [Trichophyton tonsurans CBS 112818]|uniref:Tat pathway signal sequence n=1 Tax=Trichophyton tonsurans (strain CBS 112818) TaxID=647933 RepID=F2RVE4_TRIT1|nr:hypothetical protein TESG_02781 [Trichophyton tonsurans CBS 112818]